MRRFLAALAFVAGLAGAAVSGRADVAYFNGETVINSTGTNASTTNFVFVGSGSACIFIPQTSGKFTLTWLGQGSNSVATDGFKYKMVYGTGTAPAASAAAPGSGTIVPAAAIAVNATSATAAASVPVMMVVHLSLPAGWTAGTVYWFDPSFTAVTGGTASLASAQCGANEE